MADPDHQGDVQPARGNRWWWPVGFVLVGGGALAFTLLWKTGLLAAFVGPPAPRTLIEYETAAQEAQSAYEKAPSSISQVDREVLEDHWATTLNELGSYYIQHKLVESAKGRFSKAIEVVPEYAAPHYNLASIFFQEGQVDRAIVQLKAAIHADPHHVRALCLLGECYLNKNLEADAMETFQRAVDVDPSSVQALNGMGRVFQRRHIMSDAIDRFKKALEIQPTNPYLVANLADCNLALKKWDEAIALYEKAMVLGFNPPDFLIDLGTAYTGKGLFKKGYDSYMEASAQVGTDNPMLLALIAVNLVGQKKYKEALADFQRSLNLYPDYTVAKLHLGHLYEQMGDRAAAWNEFDAIARSQVQPHEKAQALLARGHLSLEQGRIDEALATFREVALMGVSETKVYLSLARAYHALKDDPLALSYYSAAQKGGEALEDEDKTILASIHATLPKDLTPGGSSVVFEDVAKAAGIAFVHYAGFPLLHLPQSVGPGVAVIDYDGSGYEGLYFTNSSDFYGKTLPPAEQQSSRLYRNNGDGTFTDVTRQAGLFENRRFGCASIFVDVNNDGYPDLITTGMGFVEFYRNNGDGTFTHVPGYIPIKYLPGEVVSGPSAADFDRDGFLDVFLPSYTVIDLAHIPPQPFIDDEPGNFPVPITLPPLDYKGAVKHLLHNRGTGSFDDVTAKAGVSNLVTGHERGLQSFFADIDNDGWPDLLIGNDVGDFAYYHNEHDGTFKDLAKKTWINDGRGNMGIAVGDFNWTGSQDIVITHWAHDSIGFYRNEFPRRAFTDLVVPLGLVKTHVQDVSWGTGFFDYNNDGFLDLYWVNGHTQASVYTPPACYTTDKNLPVPQKAFLYEGDGKRFVDVSASTGFSHDSRVARASAVFDFDHDGAQDIVITSNYGAVALLKNQGKHGHWIDFELVGTHSNRQAVGSRVKIQWNGRTHWTEVHLGSSYFAQETLVAHFGLGSQTTVTGAQVVWPSGKVTQLAQLPADRIVRVVEPY